MARTIHILDPGFIYAESHHYAYNRALAETADARGESPRVLGSRETPAFADAPYTLIRSFGFAEPYVGEAEEAGRDIIVTGAMVDQLGKALERDLTLAVSPGDTVVLHTLRHQLLIAILRWASQCPATPLRVSLLFHNSVSRSARDAMRHFAESAVRFVFQELALPDGVELALFAETPSLVAYYAELSGRPVAEIPPLVHYDAAPLPFATPAPEAPPQLAFVGPLRPEKGARLLMPAYETVIRRWPELRIRQHDPKGNLVRDAIPAPVAARMEILDGHVSQEALYRLIQESSAVLLPYAPSAYRLRSSGILAEVLGLGRPVVVTEGTWMADFLRRFDPMPGVILADFSATSLARALETLLADLPAYLAAAASAAPSVRSLCDSHRVAETLLAPPEGFAPARA